MAFDGSQHGKDKKAKKATTYSNNRKKKYIKETREEDGSIKIPDEVVDKDSWYKYIELHDKAQLDPDLYYKTSDPDLIVNLLQKTYRLDNAIKHLPQGEKDTIFAIAARLRGIMAQAASYKKKALGANYFKKGAIFKAEDNRIQNRRFYEDRGSELIEYFGRYFTLSEVHKIITEEWGYTISVSSLTAWRIENIEAITNRQEQFKKDYSDVRLGYKRSRLDELTYLYNTRRDIYGKGKKLDDSRELRAILEQVRKEVEGDTLTINGKLSIEHDIKIQQHVNAELMKTVNIKALVLSRVAAKLNINPAVLQYQLVNSYYAKFTGFKPADNDLLTDEIVYPSAQIYDFDVLKAKNQEVEAEDAEIISEMMPPVKEEEKSDIEDIRAAVMKRLIEAKAMNDKTKETIINRTQKGK